MNGDIQLRSGSDGPELRVLASRTDHDYAYGGYTEVVAPGAFTRSLARSDLDVVLNVEHNVRDVLARTPVTLQLEETSRGLEGTARLDPQDPLTAQTIRRIERGVLKEASFAFRVEKNGDSWSEDHSRRTIRAVDLHRGDLALTVYGANPATGATVARSASERRALAQSLSREGWCGPGVLLRSQRAGWKNQHGQSCATCDGSGTCPDCDGQGWVANDGGDDGGRASRRPGRGRLLPDDSRALRAQHKRLMAAGAAALAVAARERAGYDAEGADLRREFDRLRRKRR